MLGPTQESPSSATWRQALVATEKNDPHAAATQLADQAIPVLKHGSRREAVADFFEGFWIKVERGGRWSVRRVRR